MKKNSWKALIMASYLILISGGYCIKKNNRKQEKNIINVEEVIDEQNDPIVEYSIDEQIIEPTPTLIVEPIQVNTPIIDDIEESNLKSNEEIAYEVIGGLWSEGEERQKRLTEAGYNYDIICTIVNKILIGDTVEIKPKRTYSGKFAYTNQNSIIYDENGNILYNVDSYQKAIVLNNDNERKHVIVSGLGDVGDDITIEGYIDNYCLTELPDTFVEVDISLQKVYLYENGELVLEANVITGGPDLGTTPGTNVGCTEILLKEYNTELKGPTWSGAFVDVFIKFNYSGEGYHDADNWRSDDEYTLHRFEVKGSHGCVNMKKEDVLVLDRVLKVGDISLIHN